jgi:hypothetical protein
LRISAFLEEPGLVREYDGLDAVAEAEPTPTASWAVVQMAGGRDWPARCAERHP